VEGGTEFATSYKGCQASLLLISKFVDKLKPAPNKASVSMLSSIVPACDLPAVTLRDLYSGEGQR
jgi:hypothetical protein